MTPKRVMKKIASYVKMVVGLKTPQNGRSGIKKTLVVTLMVNTNSFTEEWGERLMDICKEVMTTYGPTNNDIIILINNIVLNVTPIQLNYCPKRNMLYQSNFGYRQCDLVKACTDAVSSNYVRYLYIVLEDELGTPSDVRKAALNLFRATAQSMV